jgi:hypothetical protein
VEDRREGGMRVVGLTLVSLCEMALGPTSARNKIFVRFAPRRRGKGAAGAGDSPRSTADRWRID